VITHDFEGHLRPFCFGGCGFKPTNAGLTALLDRRRQLVRVPVAGP
jgi:hypothetical protein